MSRQRRRAGPRRVYWDANLFIDSVSRTPDRIDVLDALWDDLASSNPATVAFTSTLTIAEVAFATHEKNLRTVDPTAIEKIDGFWALGSPIQLVEVYRSLTRQARDMMRSAHEDKGFSLKPPDAIHFASAQRQAVERFLTYDDKLWKYSGMFGFKVQAPMSDRLPLKADTPAD